MDSVVALHPWPFVWHRDTAPAEVAVQCGSGQHLSRCLSGQDIKSDGFSIETCKIMVDMLDVSFTCSRTAGCSPCLDTALSGQLGVQAHHGLRAIPSLDHGAACLAAHAVWGVSQVTFYKILRNHKTSDVSWACWYTLVIQHCGRLRQEDYKFKPALGNLAIY